MKSKPTDFNGTTHSNSMDISAPNLQKSRTHHSFIWFIMNIDT